MIFILCFFSGICFILAIQPILESLISLICNIIELQSYKVVKKINEIQSQLPDNTQEQPISHPMGFQTDCIGIEYQDYPNEEEEDDN